MTQTGLTGKQQPPCWKDWSIGLVDCGNWDIGYTLPIPQTTDWVSGVYVAKLTRDDTGLQSYIIFTVRDDSRPADYLFESSVTTWQAYNPWNGTQSLYDNWPMPQVQGARKVSFNRPYALSAGAGAAYGVGAGEF